MLITTKCRAVANYIIEETNKFNEDKSLREQVIMSGRRLQKLLYFCNIEYMKIHNGKSFFEDDFYAWPSGPVIPNVYRVYIQYQDGKMFPRYEGEIIELTAEEKSIIDKILNQTQELDSIDLINITNINNGPWQKLYNEHDSEHNQTIPKEEIYGFYLDKNESMPKHEQSGPVLTKKKTPPRNTGNK